MDLSPVWGGHDHSTSPLDWANCFVQLHGVQSVKHCHHCLPCSPPVPKAPKSLRLLFDPWLSEPTQNRLGSRSSVSGFHFLNSPCHCYLSRWSSGHSLPNPISSNMLRWLFKSDYLPTHLSSSKNQKNVHVAFNMQLS